MRYMKLGCAALALVLMAGCQESGSGFWFRGDFAAAQIEAKQRETLIMMDFYTDWCSWCRRLDEETFSDPRVQKELAELVPLKVNAEKGGQALAERYRVDGYPTIVFVDGEGEEVDRIAGYLPPERFLEQLKKIRTGDTFVACLSRLDENPADLDALRRSVEGLLERSDPEGAISRLEAFDTASPKEGHEECRLLMFRARGDLHNRYYSRVAKVYRHGTLGVFEVPDTRGLENLHELLSDEWNLEDDGIAMTFATALREARMRDGRAVLDIVSGLDLTGEHLIDTAAFAYATGQYSEAGRLYSSWYEKSGDDASSSDLNRVAWRLYLMREQLDTALEMADKAYQMDHDADIGDTVARILYVSGRVDEAIAVQRKVVEQADEGKAAGYRDAIQLMETQQELGDEPSFATYPGIRED